MKIRNKIIPYVLCKNCKKPTMVRELKADKVCMLCFVKSPALYFIPENKTQEYCYRMASIISSI